MQPLNLTAPGRRGPSVYDQIVGAAVGNFAGALAGRAAGAVGDRVFGQSAERKLQDLQIKNVEQEMELRAENARLKKLHDETFDPILRARYEAETGEIVDRMQRLAAKGQLELQMFEHAKSLDTRRHLLSEREIALEEQKAATMQDQYAKTYTLQELRLVNDIINDDRIARAQEAQAAAAATNGGSGGGSGSRGGAVKPLDYDNATAAQQVFETAGDEMLAAVGFKTENPATQILERNKVTNALADTYAGMKGISTDQIMAGPVDKFALKRAQAKVYEEMLNPPVREGAPLPEPANATAVSPEGVVLRDGKPVKKPGLLTRAGQGYENVGNLLQQKAAERELTAKAQGAPVGLGWFLGANETDPEAIKRLATEEIAAGKGPPKFSELMGNSGFGVNSLIDGAPKAAAQVPGRAVPETAPSLGFGGSSPRGFRELGVVDSPQGPMQLIEVDDEIGQQIMSASQLPTTDPRFGARQLPGKATAYDELFNR